MGDTIKNGGAQLDLENGQVSFVDEDTGEVHSADFEEENCVVKQKGSESVKSLTVECSEDQDYNMQDSGI